MALSLGLALFSPQGLTSDAELPSHDRPAQTLAELQERFREIISQPAFESAVWGIKVISLSSDRTVFGYRTDKLMVPASNVKLATAAFVLHRLGPEHRIVTSVYSRAQPRNGVVFGDLIVFGRGDPSLSSGITGEANGSSLRQLAQRLADQGIKEIRGDLVGDAGYFVGPPYGSGWTWDDLQRSYGAPVSALTVDANTIELVCRPAARTGLQAQISHPGNQRYFTVANQLKTIPAGGRSAIDFFVLPGRNHLHLSGAIPSGDEPEVLRVPVADPAHHFVFRFDAALKRAGIRVRGGIKTRGWLDDHRDRRNDGIELGRIASPPMGELVTSMLKGSRNLDAQLLLLQTGAYGYSGQTRDSTTTQERALRELKRFLGSTGQSRDSSFLEEGVGLSRADLLTPGAIIDLLRFMHYHPHGARFQSALPVAGVDGTLSRRMRGSAAAGNARAKTGTLRHVNALSGYVESASGEPLIFSILLNHFYRPTSRGLGRAAIDAMVVELARWEGTSR